MKEIHTILLADDDPDDQELIVQAFTEVNPSFKFHIVNGGREVLDFLSAVSDTNLPCLIVLDYNMPELNGEQVLQKLTNNSRYEAIPKIILSTSSNPKNIKDCLGKGAHAYHVKPDNFSQLITLAKEMLKLCGKAA